MCGKRLRQSWMGSSIRCRMRTRAAIVVLTGMLAVATLVRADDPPSPTPIPAVFSPLPLADAITKSRQNNSVVIADFTAEWCAPCKLMERTVFPDARVEKWFKDHGAAVIRIDTDKEAALRTEYAVSAWPTFIGFKNGELIDRRLGGMTTDQFLTWLEKVDRAGKAAPGTETIVLPAPGTRPTGEAIPQAGFVDQLQAARATRESGKFDKALADLLRMWRSAPESQTPKPRYARGFVAEELKSLMEQHAPAREQITAERDRLESALKSPARTFDDLDGWLALNSVLRDDARTLAWFDRIKGDVDSRETILQGTVHLRPVLERAERWGDILPLIPDLAADLRLTFEVCSTMPVPERLDQQTKDQMAAQHKNLFRYKAAGLYAGLLMLGRDEEATKLATMTIGLDDTPAARIALVEKALRLEQGRKAQVGLLDEAAKAGADVAELRKKAAASPK